MILEEGLVMSNLKAGVERSLSEWLLQYMAQRRTMVALHTWRYFGNSININEAKDKYKQMLLYMIDSCLVAIKGLETSIVA